MAVVHAPRVLYPSSLAGAGMGVMNGGSLLFNLEVGQGVWRARRSTERMI
jgi:hypothetical protein